MNRIHFGTCRRPQRLKVLIGAVDKNCTVCALCFMALTRSEFHLAFQIDVMCREQALFQIGIHGSDRKIQFWVVGNDLIRGLSLFNKQ